MLFVALSEMYQKVVHCLNIASGNIMKSLAFVGKRNPKLQESADNEEGVHVSLLNELNQDMKIAMKQKDKDTLSVIRMVKSSIQNETIKLGKEDLSTDEELTILSKELKQRKDSLQEFSKANRTDLVENLEKEIHILQEYMPKQLSDDELSEIIQSTIREIGATSIKDMGEIMKAVMPKVKGKADGARINMLVKEYIS